MPCEVDIEDQVSLSQWLRRRGCLGESDRLEMRVLPGGVSNRTVLVQLPGGQVWVLKQALSRLRVAVEWFSSPDRIYREALGMRWLNRLAPDKTVPQLLFEDRDQHLLAMEAVPEPHDTWKALLLQGVVQDSHIRQSAQLLGTIHRSGSARRDELAEEFADRSFFESLRIEPYYTYTATVVSDSAEFLGRLTDETRQLQLTLVHGDYSPKNTLIFQNRLVLIDHEVIHYGDPAFDAGFLLTHLLSKAHHMPERRQVFKEAALLFWRTYMESLGDVPWLNGLESRAVRHTLGCLLARARGRSPLEYLSESERACQATAVLCLMRSCPTSLSELTARWLEQKPQRGT